MTAITPKVRRSPASNLINLETYTSDTDLVISKAPGPERPFVGAVYRMSPLSGGGGEFSTVVQNVFKAVPDHSVIQVSLLVYPDHDAPEAYLKGKTLGGHVVQDLVRRQAALYRRGLSSGELPDLPGINKRTVYISLAVPHRKADDDAIESSSSLQQEFFTSLRGCGFHDVEQININQLVGVYRQITNIYQPATIPVLDETLDLRYQVFGPDQTFDFRDPRVGVINDDTFCTTVTVKSYPEEPFHGMMNLLSGAPFNKGSVREGGGQRIDGPYMITTTVRVANQRREWTRVESAIRSRQTHQPLPIKLGVEDTQRVLADLQEIKRQCAEDGTKFVHVSTNAFLFARSREAAIRAGASVKGTLDKLGFDGRDVVGTGLVRLAQSLPLNFSTTIADEIAGEAPMASSEVGSLLPVYGDYLGNVTPDFASTGMAYPTRRGTMHYFDSYVSNSNFNGVMAAESGAGKSFSLQARIVAELAEGDHIVLLDNGRSSMKFCAAVGGEYNEFAGSKGWRPSLTPFSHLTDEEFDEQQETITSLLMLMAYDEEDPDPAARIALSEAVKAAWGQKADKAEVFTVISCLETIVSSAAENQIQNQVHVAAANLIPRLRAFVDSPTRGPYFRGQSTLNPRSQFTVFELSGLGDDKHLKRVVLFCCINTLITRNKAIAGRKRIYVDEAQDLFDVESAASAFEGLYLKGRKDAVSVWVIVQSLLKLASFKAGEVILRQSAWKMIMAQKSEEITALIDEKIITAFADDPYFHKLLKSVESRKHFWSEILIMGKDTYEVVRLYVDKFTNALFSSEGAERGDVLRMMDAGVDAIEAVTKVMGDKKARRKEWMRSFVEMCTNHDGLTLREILTELKELEK